jgi:hypothetical protein
MDWEWTFCVKYDDLSSLARSRDETHIIRLAERLRGFLADADNIADLANHRFGLNTRFSVPRVASSFASTRKQGIAFNESLIVGPDPKRKFHDDVSIDQFRKMPILTYNARTYTVLEIVIAAANVAGGIHSRPKSSNRWLVPLCEEIFRRNRAAGLKALKCIASYVVDAYAGLRETFLMASGISQPRRSRQPLFITADGFSATEFDGNSLLEDVIRIEHLSALSIYIVIAFGDQEPGPRIFMDAGIRDKAGPRFSLGYEVGYITFRFIDECGTVSQVAARGVPRKQFAVVIARCVPARMRWWKRKGIILSLSVDNSRTSCRYSGIKVPPTLEVKQTIGTDIFGRQGAVFQMTESGLSPKAISVDEERRLLDNVRRSPAMPPGWVHSKGKAAYITKLYNQAHERQP